MRKLGLFGFLLVGFALPVAVEADQSACPVTIGSTDNTSLTDLHVASTLSSLQAGSCAGGVDFVSLANPCPAVGIAAVSGAYCGPIVPPGGYILCKWSSVIGTVPTKLFVGFDWSGDNILQVSSGEKVWGPMDENTYYSVQNSGGAGRMIAFPTNVLDDRTRPSDESIIGCNLLI